MTVSHQKSRNGNYYINSQSLEDYYASMSEKEPPGIWHFSAGANGPVLAMFGLANGSKFTAETTEDFRMLCAGFDPRDASELTQNAGKSNRIALHDFTFSAPKSLSVVWGLTQDDELRKEIGDIQLKSVQRAIDFMSERGAYTRRGKGGAIKERGALIAALFEHGSSRENDMQLHIHATILNLVQRMDGTFGALETREMMRWQGASASLYHAGLAHGARVLGARVRMEGKIPEIDHIPAEVMRAFSKRRVAIEKRVEKLRADLGMTGDAALASRGLCQKATIETRDKKGELTRAELKEIWLKEGAALGYTERQILEAFSHEPYKPLDDEQLMELAREAVAELTEITAVFGEPALITAIAVKLCGQADVEQILRTAEAMKSELLHAEKIDLENGLGTTCFTTEDQLLCEEHIKDLVQRQSPEHKLDAKLVEKAITQRDNEIRATVAKVLKKKGGNPDDAKGLEQEQKDSIRHIFMSDDAVSVLEGTPGAGKTFSIKSVGEIYASVGYQVHGLSGAWTQALNLKKQAELDSGRAITDWLADIENGKIILDPKSVVILDEASMVGTREMHALLRACDRAGCRVVLLGDTLQQTAVSAGDSLRIVVEERGSARLDTIRRQRSEAERQAVKDLFAGRGKEGFAPYANNTQVLSGGDAVHEAMVGEWLRAKREARDVFTPGSGAAAARALLDGRDSKVIKTHLMQATDNASIAALNRLAHDELQAAGLLGTESVRLRTMDSADATDLYEFSVGDEVVVRVNNKKLQAKEEGDAEAVYNRTKGVIVGITNRGHLRIMTTDRQIVTMDPADPKWSSREHKGLSLQHAYAQSVYAGQRVTVDITFNKDGISLNRRSAGVMMSRHRDEAHLYVDREVRYQAKMRQVDATEWHHIREFTDQECLSRMTSGWSREGEKVNATDLHGWQVGGEGRFVDSRAELAKEQLDEMLAGFERLQPGKEPISVLPFQEDRKYDLRRFLDSQSQREHIERSSLEKQAIDRLMSDGVRAAVITDAQKQGFVAMDEHGKLHYQGYRPSDTPGGSAAPVNRIDEDGKAEEGSMRGRFPPILRGYSGQVHLVHSGKDALALWTKADQAGEKRPTVIVTNGDARSTTALKATRDLISKADEVTIHPKAQDKGNATKRVDDECVRAAGGKKPRHTERAPQEELREQVKAREGKRLPIPSGWVSARGLRR